MHMCATHTHTHTHAWRSKEGKSLPWWLSSEEVACNAGDVGSFPGSRRSPVGGNCNLLQYSCLENSMDRGTWRATAHGVAKSQTRLHD